MAFERMVAQRDDLAVVSEPFLAAYYDGPEARSSRFVCTAPAATFGAVRAELLDGAAQRPTFVKDMTYQVLPAVDDALIGGCRHTFLVRETRRGRCRRWVGAGRTSPPTRPGSRPWRRWSNGWRPTAPRWWSSSPTICDAIPSGW